MRNTTRGPGRTSTIRSKSFGGSNFSSNESCGEPLAGRRSPSAKIRILQRSAIDLTINRWPPLAVWSLLSRCHQLPYAVLYIHGNAGEREREREKFRSLRKREKSGEAKLLSKRNDDSCVLDVLIRFLLVLYLRPSYLLPLLSLFFVFIPSEHLVPPYNVQTYKRRTR